MNPKIQRKIASVWFHIPVIFSYSLIFSPESENQKFYQ